MANRRKFTSQFKKKVVLEALKERDTMSALAAKYKLHPQQIATWKSHFLSHAESLFEKDTKIKSQQQSLAQEKETLLRTIGQQKVEIDFLKKSLG